MSRGPRFVQVRPAAFESACDRHGLSLTESYVLFRLVLIVDHESHTYRCTRTDLAARLSLNRANLRRILGRLVETGLVEESFPKGHDGWVFLPCYVDLVHGAVRAVRTARSETMRTGLPQTVGEDDDDSHGAVRAMRRRGTRRANSDDAMSTSTEATATGEVAAVVYIDSARKRDTSHPSVDATPSRVANLSVTAREATQAPVGAESNPAVSYAGCGLDGGGSEASPVHPRSRRDMRVTPSLRTEAPLRDPRAMGGAS